MMLLIIKYAQTKLKIIHIAQHEEVKTQRGTTSSLLTPGLSLDHYIKLISISRSNDNILAVKQMKQQFKTKVLG